MPKKKMIAILSKIILLLLLRLIINKIFKMTVNNTNGKERYRCGYCGVVKDGKSVCDKIFDTTEEARDCAYGHQGFRLHVYHCNYPGCKFFAKDVKNEDDEDDEDGKDDENDKDGKDDENGKDGKWDGGVQAVKDHRKEHANKSWEKKDKNGYKYVGNFWCLWCQKCYQLIDRKIIPFNQQIVNHQSRCKAVAYSVKNGKRAKLGWHLPGRENSWEDDIIYGGETTKEVNINDMKEFPSLLNEEFCNQITPIVRKKFMKIADECDIDYEKYGIGIPCQSCKEVFKSKDYRNEGEAWFRLQEHLLKHGQRACLDSITLEIFNLSEMHQCTSSICFGSQVSQ